MNKYAGTQTEKIRRQRLRENLRQEISIPVLLPWQKRGREQISSLFLETADNEKEHAKMWFKELNGIGATTENLAAKFCLVGEIEKHHEGMPVLPTVD